MKKRLEPYIRMFDMVGAINVTLWMYGMQPVNSWSWWRVLTPVFISLALGLVAEIWPKSRRDTAKEVLLEICERIESKGAIFTSCVPPEKTKESK